jgi:glycosyltransferase involved in cell wall biosynthesis
VSAGAVGGQGADRRGRRLRLAIVVQRYGADINGGAELHARYIAELLAAHADVRVLTTCARDYVTWRNEFAAAQEQVHGVTVERFPVSRERDIFDFGRRSAQVFGKRHSLQQELDWLASEGPVSPGLIARLRRGRTEFDFVLFFSVRYYQAYHGARSVPERAVLVPTAEREDSLGLAMFQPIFRGVRAIMYNSPEERAVIQALSGNHHVPGVVVGVGSQIPSQVDAGRVREKFGLHGPFIIYVGRIDANKGCTELFDYFTQYVKTAAEPIDLVLIGHPVLPVPPHPRIRHLGYVTDADKFDVIAASTMLVMPSYYESLSMVALEAWALGRPVLVNGACDVLLGQALRSNAGLYYENAREFGAAVEVLRSNARLVAAMGDNGRAYYRRHYDWPVIERRYLEMFARLLDDPPSHRMERLPGILARRRRNLPAAADVLRSIPAGPIRGAAVNDNDVKVSL